MISNQVGGGYPAGYGEPMEIEAQGQDFNPYSAGADWIKSVNGNKPLNRVSPELASQALACALEQQDIAAIRDLVHQYKAIPPQFAAGERQVMMTGAEHVLRKLAQGTDYRQGDADVIASLFRNDRIRSAYANAADDTGNTLVMLAASDTDPSHLPVFQTLVETAGVELNCRNRQENERVGLTPLDIVIVTTNFNLDAQRQLALTKVEMLLEHGATADTSRLSDADDDHGGKARHEPAIIRIGNHAPEITRILIDAHIQEGKIQQLTVHDDPYKGCGLDYAILYATNEQFNNIIAVLKDTIPEEGGLDLEGVVRSAEMAVEGDLPERAARLLAPAIKMNVDQHHSDSPIDPYIEDCDEGTLSLMTRLSSRDRLMIAKAAILNDVEYGVELVATMIQATPEKLEDCHKDSLYEEDLFRAEFEEQLVTEVRKKKGAQFDLGVWATNHNDAPVDFRELLVVIGEGVDERRFQLPDSNSMSHMSDG